MSVTAAQVREYDRFGPWIDEISVSADVPKLFSTYPLDLSTTRLVLKVPRNESRRNVSAGMDLYDHLVIVDQDFLTLLTRRGAPTRHESIARQEGDYGVATVALADVVAIRDDLDLLDGRLTVSTAAGDSFAIRYNGSARETATRLVNELRAHACAKPASRVGRAMLETGNAGANASALPDPGHADTHLVSRALELRSAHPGLVTWASHGRERLTPGGDGLRGAASRLVHSLSPMTLHGAAILADATALEILGRHASLVRGRAPVYSSSRVVIPFGAMDRLSVSQHPVYPAAINATVGAGEWSSAVVVPQASAMEALFSEASARV